MRYIGNKENVLENIYTNLQSNNISGETFFDFFAGTTNVGRFFKSKGYQVSSSDILYLSYCLQKAYIENNVEPKFENLIKKLPKQQSESLFQTPLEIIAKYLSSLEGVEGFIFKNYTPTGTKELQQPRMYFIDENGKKIDAIRLTIENWKNENLISENEYFVLLACLIETVGFYSNIAGVYAAFHKHWDFRALRPLELRTIQFIDNGKENKVYNDDSMNLLDKIDVDILYLDPPYNERQYAPNYHILETIAKYDEPRLRGVTGMRDYSSQKSRFCNPTTALEDLNKIAKEANYKFLVLSYNSEGIMPSEKILDILKQYGTVKLEQFEYARFKSNNNGLSRIKKTVFEQLYILKREV